MQPARHDEPWAIHGGAPCCSPCANCARAWGAGTRAPTWAVGRLAGPSALVGCHTHARAHASARARAHTYTNLHTPLHTHLHIHLHSHTYTHTLTHTLTYATDTKHTTRACTAQTTRAVDARARRELSKLTECYKAMGDGPHLATPTYHLLYKCLRNETHTGFFAKGCVSGRMQLPGEGPSPEARGEAKGAPPVRVHSPARVHARVRACQRARERPYLCVFGRGGGGVRISCAPECVLTRPLGA